MTEPDRLPTADVIAEAFAGHERAELERGHAFADFLEHGMNAVDAADAAARHADAVRTGQAPPTITGRPAIKDPNSR